jgi:hypothetical protein
MKRLFLTCLIVAAWSAANVAHAGDPTVARQAWVALAKIERSHGIPRGLLHSMSLVETGQGLKGQLLPWPYTVGVNPTGQRKFKTVADTLAEVESLQTLGFKRFNLTINTEEHENISPVTLKRLLEKTQGRMFSLQGRHFGERFKTVHEAVTFAQGLLQRGYKNMDIGLMQINWRYHGNKFASLAEAFDPFKNASYAVEYLQKHREERDWWQSVGRYHSGTERHAKRYIKSVYSMYKKVHRIKSS